MAPLLRLLKWIRTLMSISELRTPAFAPTLVHSLPAVAGMAPAIDRGLRCRPPVDLEVVVPAFNEAMRLPVMLRKTVDYLGCLPWRTRVVVVDNGSSDETVAAVRAVDSEAVELTVIGCARPGKGAAVRRGLLSSSSPLVGFIDADLSTPIETVAETIEGLRAGAAAVIASRHAPGARFVQRRRMVRRIGGAVFRQLTRPLVTDVHDTQCGFKFFQRDAVQRALARCTVNGFAFDVELLHQIQADGGRIVEIPVAWTDDVRSSFRLVHDGVKSFASLTALHRGAGR